MDDALVLCGCVLLESRAKSSSVPGNRIDDSLVRRHINQQELRILNCLKEVLGRSLVHETHRICEPPIFRRKLHDVFFPFGVNRVASQEALCHECRIRDQFTGSLQEVSGAKARRPKGRFQEVEFVFPEAGSAFQVRPQNGECM